MEITLRNPERREWMSGWGVINRELIKMCSNNNLAAPIHVFASPPYSFLDVDKSKFNVGITMGERDDLSTYKWNFVALANQMDLIIVPGPWQFQVFKKNGVTPPIVMVPMGHAHEDWTAPLRKVKRNQRALIIDRGRDNRDSIPVLRTHFPTVNMLDCKTPVADGTAAKTEIIKKGKYTRKQIYAAYASSDVFFKWGREGWCYPILEAMSAGCLVITNCVHLPYIQSDVNCLTFRTKPELHKKLARAAKDPCDAIKAAGRKCAASFGWEKTRKRIKEEILKHAK